MSPKGRQSSFSHALIVQSLMGFERADDFRGAMKRNMEKDEASESGRKAAGNFSPENDYHIPSPVSRTLLKECYTDALRSGFGHVFPPFGLSVWQRHVTTRHTPAGEETRSARCSTTRTALGVLASSPWNCGMSALRDGSSFIHFHHER